MKKLLLLLGSVGLVASTGAAVVACGNPEIGKVVDITEFAKLVTAEAQGKHNEIGEAETQLSLHCQKELQKLKLLL